MDFSQGVPSGLGVRSYPWPWPRAHGWVGNHSSYFWFSPWDGGQEHPDLIPEVPELPSLGWVENTRAQGTAVLGTGKGGMSITSPLPHPSSLRSGPSLSPSPSQSPARAVAAPTKPVQQRDPGEAPRRAGARRDAGARKDAGARRDAEAALIQGYLGNGARATRPCHHRGTEPRRWRGQTLLAGSG